MALGGPARAAVPPYRAARALSVSPLLGRALSARGQVDAAAKVIRELLTPKEDSENEWKRMQLRELAMINGPPNRARLAIASAHVKRPLPPPPRARSSAAHGHSARRRPAGGWRGGGAVTAAA